ncbi:uncharacterized protein LOC124445201 [Xenia sp. Carnegie-2017]|uniref:uncharacterized protein LOC124445201 n=1 Tax=Xenia sp. Carnegie-2017 TaxID=2897299 RepID=UPI001F04E24C|nr:uncharacterized protein LOC124445201 [Xenia sp. Carnegie-2017]
MGLSRLIVEAVLRHYYNFVAIDNLAFAPGSCDTIPKVAIPSNAFDCSIGSFFSFKSKKCEKCPIYTYQPYPNQTRCLPCNESKGTINVGAVSERECIKVKRCDFQKGLGTTECPWHNVEGDDDFDWKLRTLNSSFYDPPRYDATGFSIALDNLAFAPGSCDTIPKVAIPSNAFVNLHNGTENIEYNK